jgi:hypothetical protein
MSRRARSSQSPRGGVSHPVVDTADIVLDGETDGVRKPASDGMRYRSQVIDALEAQR